MVDGEEKKGKLHVCPHNRRSVSHDRPYGREGGTCRMRIPNRFIEERGRSYCATIGGNRAACFA